MRSKIAVSLLVAAIGLTPGLGLAQEDSGKALEQLVIEMAQTPEQHEALARYYQSKAREARADAARHERMGQTYNSQNKLALRQKMRMHCKDMAAKQEAVAEDFDALAKLHEEEAAQMR